MKIAIFIFNGNQYIKNPLTGYKLDTVTVRPDSMEIFISNESSPEQPQPHRPTSKG